ncbi:MAG: SET domain-containing protein-lysine N-methyltransferase [Candidatus Buchananbacteria bacterium CG10_big_fil_rev_8_21_14_0_10_42_9]|uniref:SET domain-containing protein-lysine N-methyltransferase n=1 Tax=Candidatus Buchananbacteria bacterium CG10_big_fil_rev_8_21_14_0_10_42_9 TaxID=1974526 RepID=A0A2H0W0E7_9BACT|nr:MAG: SET domain-containing protein-lysine N-methyltransferase [Candidatus Buchananbacteria bacterium CG10_big_fil_rev_8_21_14_0_10_42_9]
MHDLHKKWAHRWLNPQSEARPSPIQGVGVFAKDKILKGEVVGVLGGVIVHRDEIEEYRSIMTQVGIQIDEDFFIVPTTREELERFGVFNHSCEPNVGFSNSITLVAIRDIEPKEELVFDYAFCETAEENFNCNCGSSFCRKVISSQDWKNKEVQNRYKEYYSPYLRDRIS